MNYTPSKVYRDICGWWHPETGLVAVDLDSLNKISRKLNMLAGLVVLHEKQHAKTGLIGSEALGLTANLSLLAFRNRQELLHSLPKSDSALKAIKERMIKREILGNNLFTSAKPLLEALTVFVADKPREDDSSSETTSVFGEILDTAVKAGTDISKTILRSLAKANDSRGRILRRLLEIAERSGSNDLALAVCWLGLSIPLTEKSDEENKEMLSAKLDAYARFWRMSDWCLAGGAKRLRKLKSKMNKKEIPTDLAGGSHVEVATLELNQISRSPGFTSLYQTTYRMVDPWKSDDEVIRDLVQMAISTIRNRRGFPTFVLSMGKRLVPVSAVISRSKLKIGFADHLTQRDIEKWKVHWCSNAMKDRLLYSEDPREYDFSRNFSVSKSLTKQLHSIRESVETLENTHVSEQLLCRLTESAKQFIKK
jgi:hypothetical protein